MGMPGIGRPTRNEQAGDRIKANPALKCIGIHQQVVEKRLRLTIPSRRASVIDCKHVSELDSEARA